MRGREAGGWRLIVDPPADGAWNLAVDEAILEGYDDRAAPTLRLYGWWPPALSLGRGQGAAGAHDPTFLRGAGIDLVRRATGGRAVLHEHERTYAVIGRLREPPFSGGVVETYEAIARALLAAMRALGVDARAAGRRGAERSARGSAAAACFAILSSHEIGVAGRKLIGSAQLRRRSAFLQHGSILLRAVEGRLAAAVGQQPVAEGFTDLERELGSLPSPRAVDRACIAAFRETFGVRLVPGLLSERERARATVLRAWKYDSAVWTLEGRVGERERRLCPGL